ncbi:alpha/beta fold hydrolase [Leifsonia sp. NPDC058292]|uniref:alpha/beta fold hydrolase n=1 Tax=Leifsonia sp. NPDC058292 TaxID=3346428 RepID=UPI0036DD49D2
MRSRGGAIDAASASCVVTVDTGGQGTPFLLVHGIGVSSRYFERLVPVLAKHGRVIAVNLPGFGGTPKPNVAMAVEDFARSLERTIEQLGLPPCIVVGHSMGTQISTRLSVTRPDLVAAVALLGPVMDPPARSAVRATLRLGRDTLGERPRANRLVLGDYLRCGIRWYLAVLPSMLSYRIEDDLPRIPVPTLVLRGEHDPIAPEEWTRALASAGIRSRAETVAGARHLVQHARPRETAAALNALARVAG